MAATGDSLVMWFSIAFVVYVLFDFLFENNLRPFERISVLVSEPLSEDSDSNFEDDSDTACESPFDTPSLGYSGLRHTAPIPRAPNSTPETSTHPSIVTMPHAPLLEITERLDVAETCNHFLRHEIHRLLQADEQWRNTLHAFSSQIEELTRERDEASTAHGRWRSFATENAQEKANLAARVLHLEERVVGLETDVLYLKGMKETLAGMAVETQNRLGGMVFLLEGRVAELEEELEGLEGVNEGLKREVRVLKGGVEIGVGGNVGAGEEEGAAVATSASGSRGTAEDWQYMELATDGRASM